MAAKEPLVIFILIIQFTINRKGGLQQTQQKTPSHTLTLKCLKKQHTQNKTQYKASLFQHYLPKKPHYISLDLAKHKYSLSEKSSNGIFVFILSQQVVSALMCPQSLCDG